MLSFHQHKWLLRHGASHINAWLDPRTQTTADIAWDITLHYTAGGARWRRVEMWHRPRVELYLHAFDPDITTWRDLEQIDFWDLNRESSLSDAEGWSPKPRRPARGISKPTPRSAAGANDPLRFHLARSCTGRRAFYHRAGRRPEET